MPVLPIIYYYLPLVANTLALGRDNWTTRKQRERERERRRDSLEARTRVQRRLNPTGLTFRNYEPIHGFFLQRRSFPP